MGTLTSKLKTKYNSNSTEAKIQLRQKNHQKINVQQVKYASGYAKITK